MELILVFGTIKQTGVSSEKGRMSVLGERVQAFALVNTKPTCGRASVGQTAEGVNKAN